jgi:hypothetical protein
MGWNDRNPELYEQITGLSYETDLPLDGRRTMPVGWVPPAMPETCYGCGAKGDTINAPLYESECVECYSEVCIHCCGSDDSDDGGVCLTCKNCSVPT